MTLAIVLVVNVSGPLTLNEFRLFRTLKSQLRETAIASVLK